MEQHQQNFIDGLRQMADWLETHVSLISEWSGTRLDVFAEGKADYASHVRVLMDGAGLTEVEKDASAQYQWARRHFGPHLIDVNVNRDLVCERVVVGVETVEVPDPAAPKVTVERELVEWKCSPILSAATDAPVTA